MNNKRLFYLAYYLIIGSITVKFIVRKKGEFYV